MLGRCLLEGNGIFLQATWAINRSLKQPIIGPTSCQLFRQMEKVDSRP